MDFIMPACAATLNRLYILFLLLMLPFAVQASAFEIKTVEVRKQGESYLLNADIHYELTPRIEEALHHGVPITIVQDIKIVQRTPLLWHLWDWNKEVWQHQFRYELRYHDLSQQYILYSSEGNTYRTFPSQLSALTAMGEINDYLLPREFTANPQNYVLRLKSGIDLNALPSPMRPGALISRKWNLGSDWSDVEWPSE